MRTRLVLAIGSVGLVVAIIVTLSASEPRRAGTNNVPAVNAVAALAAGQRACQPVNIPPGADRVVIGVEPVDGRPHRLVAVAIVDGMSVRGTGTAPAGASAVSIDLAGDAPAGSGRLCVRNVGAGPVRPLGYTTEAPPEVDRRAPAEALAPFRVDYYRPGEESWWALGATLADRFAAGNAGLLGPWAFWIAVASSVTAVALAVATLAKRRPGA